MQTIMQTEKQCFLCGAVFGEHLDRHHVFQSSLRNQAEKYGLWVYLCHDKCHENGKYAAHQCADTRNFLRAEAQKKAMEVYGWDLREWRERFYKNYLESDI